EGLETLYRKYKDRGLVVLGLPANDFGGQEPASNKEISAFCVNQYAIDFPMFAKTELRKNPLYADLRKRAARRRAGISTSTSSTAAAPRCRASIRVWRPTIRSSSARSSACCRPANPGERHEKARSSRVSRVRLR